MQWVTATEDCGVESRGRKMATSGLWNKPFFNSYAFYTFSSLSCCMTITLINITKQSTIVTVHINVGYCFLFVHEIAVCQFNNKRISIKSIYAASGAHSRTWSP